MKSDKPAINDADSLHGLHHRSCKPAQYASVEETVAASPRVVALTGRDTGLPCEGVWRKPWTELLSTHCPPHLASPGVAVRATKGSTQAPMPHGPGRTTVCGLALGLVGKVRSFRPFLGSAPFEEHSLSDFGDCRNPIPKTPLLRRTPPTSVVSLTLWAFPRRGFCSGKSPQQS